MLFLIDDGRGALAGVWSSTWSRLVEVFSKIQVLEDRSACRSARSIGQRGGAYFYLAWAGPVGLKRGGDRSCPYVCPSVCLFSKRVSGSSYSVENASDAAQRPSSPEMKPALAAVGSATVAVLSQSSGKFLLRVVCDVDKAENGCAVAFVIVQSYAEELGVGILEQG